jgi:hypothetical protein
MDEAKHGDLRLTHGVQTGSLPRTLTDRFWSWR